MTLRETTRKIIGFVETASGCPVVAIEDTPLKTLAPPRIARGAISHKASALREREQLFSKLSNIEQNTPSVWAYGTI
jgi:hypothetical protein